MLANLSPNAVIRQISCVPLLFLFFPLQMSSLLSSSVFSQVIKKVMKMDAAEPFNAPVDPVALGIPVSILIRRASIHFFR